MMRTRRCFTLIALATLGTVLVGCQGPGRVIDELPPPYFQPRPSPKTPTPKPLLSPVKSIAGAIIVVDAGHGGKDPGTQGHSPAPEKTLVLAVAKDVARRLADRGAKVVTTRDSDVFIELDDRAAMADRNRADLFVSIHADWSQRADVSGATFYIARNASPQSLRAALRLNSAFARAGLETRGVNRAGFRVLVGHSRPAVLVECGFLSNVQECRQLNSADYRSRIAAAIVDGIADCFSR